MYKKAFGIFVIMLLLVPILSSTVTAGEEPLLEILKIRGRSTIIWGAVVIIKIKNTGDSDAHDVTWSFEIKHPLFKMLKINSSIANSTIDIIKAGRTAIKTIGLSWIGRFEFTVTACEYGGESTSKTVKGFSLFNFIIIFPK
jgi:hypothetical protein